VGDIRSCEQCGTSFVPRREHARFCSARCRVAWNREHMGDLEAGAGALDWSVAAMGETIDRLREVRAWDRPRAFAVIGEAVRWVTIVDAALVRYHPQAYDGVLAGQAPAQRQLTEGTLAGLRFVRNRIGGQADVAEFTEPGEPGPGAVKGRITERVWKPLPEPALASLSPRRQAWEMTRYRAYQAQLAGRTLGKVFGCAAAFLKQAAANAHSITDPGVHAAR
jgi:hypothetical protein